MLNTPLPIPELETGAAMSWAGSCPPVTGSHGAKQGRCHDVTATQCRAGKGAQGAARAAEINLSDVHVKPRAYSRAMSRVYTEYESDVSVVMLEAETSSTTSDFLLCTEEARRR